MNELRKRVPGRVNIIQILCEDDLDESVYLFELGSFSSARSFLNLLGHLLTRDDVIIVGANHLSDFTKLKNDFPDDFTANADDMKIMDVQAMALNRGIVKKGVGKTTLQALCRDAGYYIPKPAHIRCGTTFASRRNLSIEAKRYCMRDVASLRILY